MREVCRRLTDFWNPWPRGGTLHFGYTQWVDASHTGQLQGSLGKIIPIGVTILERDHRYWGQAICTMAPLAPWPALSPALLPAGLYGGQHLPSKRNPREERKKGDVIHKGGVIHSGGF